jgi:dUTPase
MVEEEKQPTFVLTYNYSQQPRRLSRNSSIYIITCADSIIIPARTIVRVCTGIRIKIPLSVIGIISNCLEDYSNFLNIQVLPTTIDSTTESTLCIRVFNVGNEEVHLQTGDNLCNISFVSSVI